MRQMRPTRRVTGMTGRPPSERMTTAQESRSLVAPEVGSTVFLSLTARRLGVASVL